MYDHFADRLEAEFDRLLFALESIITYGIETDDSRFEMVAERSNESLSTPGFELQSIGSKIRALSGDTERNDEKSRLAIGEADRTDLEAHTAELEANIRQAREQGVDLRLERLASAFDLSRTHLDAFLLALGPIFDRSVSVAYGRIRGTGQPQLPTIDLLEELLVVLHRSTGDGDAVPPGEVLASPSPLFEYGILERQHRGENVSPVYDTVTVDERIVNYLKGDDSLDPILADIATLKNHDRTLSDLVFGDDTTETLEALHSRTADADDPTIYYFSGEDGTGKDRLPGALTDDATPILRADAEILADDDLTTRLLREAALQEAAIHLEGLETVTGHDDGPTIDEEDGDLEITTDDGLSVDAVVERLDDAPGDVFLSHTDEWKPDVDLENHRVETAHCPFPEYETRLEIWEEYREEVAEDYLVENVATNFRLPQRDIRRAVKTARYLCRTDGDADADDVDPDALEGGADGATDDVFAPVDGRLEREHLYEACKRYSASNLEALAEPMEPGYTFDDIYLNDKPETHLRELCGHLQYRGQVTSEWGFGEPGDRGDGVVAMFYGPPGTGKTMAAEIIANETGLDLYRVDLSQIVNKYIGETESRLAALLEEAERSNAILLFDEADSLFGERTDVADSSDRYANNVTNFLLQRLESFDGIALLTTNKRSGIDPAFKRRIAHSILFDVPQERIRRRIWREVWPDEATVDHEAFDYEFLGLFSVTPAVIRKVAKYAAYIAATEAHDGHPLAESPVDLEGVTITFDHVILALQYAGEAGGVALEQDFFQYEDKLRSYETQSVSRDIETLFKLKYGLDEESATDDGSASDERPAVDDAARADAATGADGADATAGDADEAKDGPGAETATASPDGTAANRQARQHAGESAAVTATAESEAGTGTEAEIETVTETETAAESGDPPEITGDLEPEDIVRHFYDGIRTEDLDAIEALYHSDAAIEPLTRKELIAKNMNNVSIAGTLRRTADEPARVVLEFEEETDAHRVPMTVELEPDDGRWRIVSLSHGTPVEINEE